MANNPEIEKLHSDLGILVRRLIVPELYYKDLYRVPIRIVPDPLNTEIPYTAIAKLAEKYSRERQIRISLESIHSPGTSILLLSTPCDFQHEEWKNQSFQVNGCDLSIASLNSRNQIQKTSQSDLDNETRFSLWRALVSAFGGSPPEQPDAQWRHLNSSLENQIQMTLTLIGYNSSRFEEILGEHIIVPDRVMTQREKDQWQHEAQQLGDQFRSGYYRQMCYQTIPGFGECLVDYWHDGDGRPNGEPNIIVPIEIKAGSTTYWTTATLMYEINRLAAIHLNHGNKHILEVQRILKPGTLF